MHLLRVQVPKFKALKDLDITFEQDFVPKVFPLGSQNGGGKSTLLQLIFVLLRCTQDVAKLPFVKAMLAHFIVPPKEVEPKLLAQMDIWDGKKRVEIEFLYCNDSFLRSLLEFEFCNNIFTINNNGLWEELYNREYIFLDFRGSSGTDEDKRFNKFLTEFKQKTLSENLIFIVDKTSWFILSY